MRTLAAGPGWDEPRAWHDDRSALAVSRNQRAAPGHLPGKPATDPAGRRLVFAGLLFDPPALARREGLDPALPDAALAAAWLDRYGAEALSRLDGDYALARWDPVKRRLLLATAPMAGRTLYWHASAGRIWFASTLALLFRFPGVPREPSPLNIAAHVSALVLDPADTLFHGVRLLPPGTMLLADAQGIREEPIWRPDPTRRLRLASNDEYVEAGRELLERAVSARLRGRTASTLSGGLDSSAVATTAARLSHVARLDTYTAVPPPGSTPVASRGFYADEREPVSAVAALHPNLRPHFCHSEGPSALERDPTPLFVTAARAVITTGMVGWMEPVYKTARAHGHTALLMGTAGNFSLSYDGRHAFTDFMRAGRPDLVARHLPGVSRFRDRPLAREIRNLAGNFVPGLRHRWRSLHGRPPDWLRDSPLRPGFAAEVGLFERLRAWREDGILPAATDSRLIQAHFLQRRRSRHVELYTTLSAHYGIDLLDPLSDRALVEFCLAIPREQYVLDGRDRCLARRVLADRLPAQILDQPLYGQPNAEWFSRLTPQRAEYAAELERLERVPLAAEILDLPRLKALVADWPADADAARARQYEYQSLLSRGIHMGRLLRWLDGGNA